MVIVPDVLNVRLLNTPLPLDPQIPVPFMVIVVVPDSAPGVPSVRLPPTRKVYTPFIVDAPVVVRVPVTVVALDRVKVLAIDKEPKVGRYAPEKVVGIATVNSPVQVKALVNVIIEVEPTEMLFQVILVAPLSVFNVQFPCIIRVELVVVTVPAV